MGTYAFSGQPRFVTVDFSGTYDLNAFGAAGGASAKYSLAGGLGAEADGLFQLTAGEKLEIVVGGAGAGALGANGFYAGGGGGGTFVLANTGPGGAFVPLLIAGGGAGGDGGAGTVGAAGTGSGGASSYNGGGGGSGVDGQGQSGFGFRFPPATGGSNAGGGYAGGTGGGAGS